MSKNPKNKNQTTINKKMQLIHDNPLIGGVWKCMPGQNRHYHPKSICSCAKCKGDITRDKRTIKKHLQLHGPMEVRYYTYRLPVCRQQRFFHVKNFFFKTPTRHCRCLWRCLCTYIRTFRVEYTILGLKPKKKGLIP